MSPLALPYPRAAVTRPRSATRPHQPTQRQPPAQVAQRPRDLDLGPLFEHARDALIVVDANSDRIVRWNPAAQTLLGYSSVQAIRQPVEMLVPPAVARLLHERLAHYARSGDAGILNPNAQEPLRTLALSREGEELPVELSLAPLRLSPAASCVNPAPLVLLTIRRVEVHEPQSEQDAAAIARAESERDELAARVDARDQLLDANAREVGQALMRARRAVGLLTRRVAEHSSSTSPSPWRLALLGRAVQARTAAVQRALDETAELTALGTDRFTFEPERVNLVPLVGRVVARTRKRAPAHRLQFGAPQGLTTQGDAQRLAHVVEHLLEQAIRRNPRGAWIDIDLRRPLAGLARIEVRDYGRRLSARERDRLPDGAAPERGWRLARQIVERHGGTLSTESLSEGGLRTIVTLPTNGGQVKLRRA